MPPRPSASVPEVAGRPRSRPRCRARRRTAALLRRTSGSPRPRRRSGLTALRVVLGTSGRNALTGVLVSGPERIAPMGGDKCHSGGMRAALRIASGARQDAARWRHVTQVLDKTDLFGTLPPELLEQLRDRTALARLRRGDVDLREGRPGDQPLRRVLGPGRDRGQGDRRPRVGALGARPRRAVRRDVDVRRRRPLGARPGRSRPCTSSPSTFDDVREVLVAPARRAVGRRADPRPPPARDRRGARRRDVPRRDRPHREAPARARRRRRRLPHAAHARGAGRHGRRVTRAREQGDRAVREARLARDLRPQPYHILDRAELEARAIC